MNAKLMLAGTASICILSGQVVAKSCAQSACIVGQHVIVYTTRSEPVAICPTDALTTYSNFILGLTSVQGELGAQPPKNPNDLEVSLTGESAVLIQMMRKNSGVSSASEAFAACDAGKAKVKGVIVEINADSGNARVSALEGRAMFWIPLTFLDKQ